MWFDIVLTVEITSVLFYFIIDFNEMKYVRMVDFIWMYCKSTVALRRDGQRVNLNTR